MASTIWLKRKSGLAGMEVSDELGHVTETDTSPADGGENFGFRPMQLVLAGLGSCSAIDIVSILAKQKQTLEDIQVEVAGEREPGKIPSLWASVKITFHLTGVIDAQKANRAAELSMEKYCSVAETLRRGGTKIEWSVNLKPANVSAT